MQLINSKIITARFCLLVMALLSAGNSFADIKLPAVFSDKMVLQQQSDVAIWGWASPGEQVTIMGSWSVKPVSIKTDASGNWKGLLPTPKAGGPYTLRVKGNNSIELKDVLIGEVWLCSGQSNMAFTMKGVDNSKQEIAAADFPFIRYFSVKRQYGLQEFNDCPESSWQPTSPANAPSFSAVAYYFAKKIYETLHVPVGIIYTAWGGTPAEAWTPGPVLKNDSLLSRYIDRWKDIQDKVGKDSAEYHLKLNKWEKDGVGIKKPEEPQTLYYYKRPWREPSVLFNGMIKPVIPYGIKGVLWYQGESNVSYADEYYHLFGSMINSWRNKWKDQKDFSFYFVQIAPYDYNSLDAAARLREAQDLVAQHYPYTGMAVTTDLGNMKDIHFTHKKQVGDRLALIALAKNYGNKKITWRGPESNKAYRDREKVIVAFKPAGPALATTGNNVKGFELGYKLPGSDSVIFVSATAKIENNTVVVWNDAVRQPVEVRYAWLLAGEANLSNKEGLPAAPFRIKLN